MLPLELLHIFQFECLGRGDVDGEAEEVRHSGCRSAHHLVHHFAHAADGQFVELKLFLGGFRAHEDIHDHLHVTAAQQHNVAAVKTFHIADRDTHGRLQIADLKIRNLDH